MKILITESQKEKIALSWMNKNFSPDQLEIVHHPMKRDTLFKKNGKYVMMQELDRKGFIFDDSIFSFLEAFLSMEKNQIKELLKVWLEDTFKLEGYTIKQIEFSDMQNILDNILK